MLNEREFPLQTVDHKACTLQYLDHMQAGLLSVEKLSYFINLIRKCVFIF